MVRVGSLPMSNAPSPPPPRTKVFVNPVASAPPPAKVFANPVASAAPPAPPVTAQKPAVSITVAYEREKTLWTKVWTVLGQLLSAPLRWVATGLRAVTTLVVAVAQRLLDLAIEGPVWLFGKIFHLDTATARRALQTAIAVPFQAVAGVVRGVLEAPGALMGTALSTLRQLFSFEWVTHGQRTLQLLLTPFTGTLIAAIWPLGRGATAVDDVLHPPRELSDEERTILLALYPADTLTHIRIHPETSWLSRVMSRSAIDFTLGTDIYTTPKSRPVLLLHELVHCLQARDAAGGVPTFLTDYCAEILSRLIATGDAIEAYKAEDQEVQARRLSENTIIAYELARSLNLPSSGS